MVNPFLPPMFQFPDPRRLDAAEPFSDAELDAAFAFADMDGPLSQEQRSRVAVVVAAFNRLGKVDA